jgi:2-keto-3-deoxy-L-rhamnonate aldolase RhmA
VEHVDEIAAVDGIDVLWIGHNDLSISLGVPGQLTHPSYVAATERVKRACKVRGKALGFMASSVEEGRELVEWGARCIAYGGDIHLYRQALGAGIAAIREAAEA